MKLKISRITEDSGGFKPIEDVVLNVYEDRDNYVSYQLENSIRKERKLVFKNINHKKELNKHLMFEHFYIILIVASVVFILSLFSENLLMIVISLAGIIYIPYRLISSSEVAYKLIFEGLTIYETNHIGKRIIEFNPSTIKSSDSDKYENDFIFMSGRNLTDKKRSSLIIMEGLEFEIRDLLRKYFNDFSFVNSIRMRGQE